jgi:hypothetical protein
MTGLWLGDSASMTGFGLTGGKCKHDRLMAGGQCKHDRGMVEGGTVQAYQTYEAGNTKEANIKTLKIKIGLFESFA